MASSREALTGVLHDICYGVRQMRRAPALAVSRRYLTSLNVLMVAGGLVFLIACANVATLLLARAGARRKEMSLRLAMPGVRGVSMSRMGLVTGWVSNSSASLDADTPATEPETRRIHWNQVGPDFFETLGMSLLIGRGVDTRDTATGPQVAVVNEAMAKQLFPGQHPIGKRFWYGRDRSGAPMEVVGVVRDAKYASLRAPAPPTAYLPYTQSRRPLSSMCFEVRAEGDPMALVSGIRRAVSDMVPGVPIGDVKTQARLIDASLGLETTYVRLFAFFGLVALLLGCVGLYGTMSNALGRRTREIGIRMALGAGRGRVLGSALAEALVIAVLGVSAGGFLAWAGARYVRSLLFEVTPLDLPTIAAAVAIMLTVALGAGSLPARRASRLEPLEALREE